MLKRVNIKKGGYSKLYQKDIPNSIAAKLVCVDNEFTLPTKIFTGSNCIKDFIQWIFEQKKYCNHIYNKKFNQKFRMTIEDENNYKNSQDCCICNQKIKDKEEVRYRCYLTSEYKECKECSKIPRKLPIIFHNLEGYDGQLIFRDLNNSKDIDIQVISKTNEKYMSIIIRALLLDSLQFGKTSLDSLAGNLEDSGFKHLLSDFPKEELEILKKKTHIHMNGLNLIESLFIQDYSQKKEKEVKVIVIF